MKKKQELITGIFATSLVLLSTLPGEASPNKTYRRFRVSFTPAGKGHPQYTSGGAVRSATCNVGALEDKYLTAIVPSNEQSLTTKTHPTFLAYVPPIGASQGIFAIKNKPENFYYEQKITLPTEGGIVAIPLSAKTPGLEEGDYSWYLKIQCGESPSMNDPFIGANIKKVNNEDFASFWYDIAEESLNTPEWDKLMNQINLNFLIDENVTYVQ